MVKDVFPLNQFLFCIVVHNCLVKTDREMENVRIACCGPDLANLCNQARKRYICKVTVSFPGCVRLFHYLTYGGKIFVEVSNWFHGYGFFPRLGDLPLRHALLKWPCQRPVLIQSGKRTIRLKKQLPSSSLRLRIAGRYRMQVKSFFF